MVIKIINRDGWFQKGCNFGFTVVLSTVGQQLFELGITETSIFDKIYFKMINQGHWFQKLSSWVLL